MIMGHGMCNRNRKRNVFPPMTFHSRKEGLSRISYLIKIININICIEIAKRFLRKERSGGRSSPYMKIEGSATTKFDGCLF